jgi:hypothetical protein
VTVCTHLQPLVDELDRAGIKRVRIESPYGNGGTWWQCECTFVEAALRARLKLDPALTYFEYNGMAAGADATWSCKEHNVVLIGPHPSFASRGTPRLR